MFRAKNTFDPDLVKMKMRAAMGLYTDSAAKKMEADAKTNAPWQDRTTNARNSIQGTWTWVGDDLFIFLSGNIDYFIYLELAHEKKYAILVPTIEKYGPKVIEGFQRLVR